MLCIFCKKVSLEFFIDIKFFRSHYGPGVDSASNKNQGTFLGGKGGRCVRLTTLLPSCAVVMKSGNFNFLEPSGPLQACNGTALPLCTNSRYLHSIWDLHNGTQTRCVCVLISRTGAKPSFGRRQCACNLFLISHIADSSDQARISEVGVIVLLHANKHGTENKFKCFKVNANVLIPKSRKRGGYSD